MKLARHHAAWGIAIALGVTLSIPAMSEPKTPKEKLEAMKEKAKERREDRKEKREEKKEELKEKLDNMTDEEKEEWKKKHAERKEERAEVREAWKEWKDKRKERRKARRDELKEKLGDDLKRPAVKAELKIHARRMARLNRIRVVAKAEGKDEVVKRVDTLIAKEKARHDKHIETLKAKKDNAEEAK